jgi:hypothetical protein
MITIVSNNLFDFVILQNILEFNKFFLKYFVGFYWRLQEIK